MPPVKGNRNWSNGKLPEVRPAIPTEFEDVVRSLELNEKAYTGSQQLRNWCELNKNHRYVPEWLLAAWDMRVTSDHAL